MKKEYPGLRSVCMHAVVRTVLWALAVGTMLVACGGGGAGQSGTVQTPPATNAAPTQVVLVEVSSSEPGALTASWMVASDDSTMAENLTYQVHVSTDPAFEPSAATKFFEGRGITAANVTGLLAGTIYTVVLVVSDDKGASTISVRKTITTAATSTGVLAGVNIQKIPMAHIVSATGSAVVLPATATVPVVGSFISSAEANNGRGFLRRVTSIAKTSSTTTLHTVPASLNEVFGDLDISSSLTMDTVPETVASLEGTSSVRVLSRYNEDQQPATYEYSWAQTGLRYSAGVRAATTEVLGQRVQAATGTGRVQALATQASTETVTKVFTGSAGFTVTDIVNTQFAPTVSFQAKLGLLTPTYTRFVMSAAPRLDQVLKINATAAGSVDVTQAIIAPRKFTKVIETPSGIPVVISGVLSLDMRLQGDVSGALQALEKISIGFDEISAGLEYKNGVFTPVKSVSPVYAVRMGGSGKASAHLQISLLPRLELTGYETLMGTMVLEPHVSASASVEGSVQMDTAIDFDTLQGSLAPEADFRLVEVQFTAGIKVWLYADLHFFDSKLVIFPTKANASDYTTYHPEVLQADTVIAGLPKLSVALPNGVGDGTAIQVRAMAVNVLNPLKSLFATQPDSYIPWGKWTRPRLIPPRSVSTGYVVTGSSGNYVVSLTEPGTYTLRVGGHSAWGTWARQYVDVPIVFGGARDPREGWYVGQYMAKRSTAYPDLPAPYTGQTGKIWIKIFKNTVCEQNFCVAVFAQGAGNVPALYNVEALNAPHEPSNYFYNKIRPILEYQSGNVFTLFQLGWAQLQSDGTFIQIQSMNDSHWHQFVIPGTYSNWLYFHDLNWSAAFQGIEVPGDFPGRAAFVPRCEVYGNCSNPIETAVRQFLP